MEDFFPTDVRVRVNGDRDAASPLLGAARELLFKALLLQGSRGKDHPIGFQKIYPDGSIVAVLLMGAQKIVTIRPAAPVLPPPEIPPPPELPTFTGVSYTGLLHGWLRNFVLTTIPPDLSTLYLDSYRPTPLVQSIQKVTAGFNPNARLAGEFVAQDAQGSRYSGAMKRLVQAIYSIGIINDDTPSFITGHVPSPTRRTIANTYAAGRRSTHGIYNAGNAKWWLIEISIAHGVLAMPLITMQKTRGSSDHWQRLGDTETARVVDEFGGFPTGESFPAGAALATAIAAGKVLQLLTPADLDPFYSRSHAYAGSNGPWGWAFNESGNQAHNTGWTLMNPATGVTSSARGALDRFTPLRPFGEHWKISIDLSAYDLTAPARGLPVGTGTATLSLVTRGQIQWNTFDQVWFPDGTGKLVRAYDFMNTRPDHWINYGGDQNFDATMISIGTQIVADYDLGPDGFGGEAHRLLYDTGVRGCTVYVYFRGDFQVRVNFCPGHYLNIADGVVEYSPPAFVSTDGFEPRELCWRNTDPVSLIANHRFFDQTVLFPDCVREGWVSIHNIQDGTTNVGSTRDDWYCVAPTWAAVLHFSNPYDSYIITQTDIVTGRGTPSSPPGIGVSFDININAGPSFQYMASDGAYYTSNPLPLSQVIRSGVPSGLGNFRPKDMAFIGSPQG